MSVAPVNIELRQLRCLVAIMEFGSFTDAAIELGVSQAAVSRNLAALERSLGVRMLERTTRAVHLTAAGERTLRQARRLLVILDDLEQDARSGTSILRVGYAWSALGKHTIEFQRRWAAAHPLVDLRLVRTNTATAGLTEGVADLAILRRAPDTTVFDVVLVGVEKRFCAMASDDPLASRRSVTLAQVAELPIAIDARTGSTAVSLWPADAQPARTIPTGDIDDWLTAIGAGRARGVTAEATAHQYRRPGIVYRVVRDAPPLPVYAAWLRSDPPSERTAVIELLAGLYG
ncbi:LysR family transcriptional regulator [Cryobacterium roopkundense]|uniref:DNA-binding transcriptional LysR family regulator n=1 Tax=Cryobacterium roopkundense TaxID=1001240 RepID=A0A7W9E2T2_9MICO|nr:LysR family transcriptional regulator [Cryobacterium roopkundense]MBB5639624.1 DNA-binding transcriptional LysR family regulator [Cryobacterium roopkundense]